MKSYELGDCIRGHRIIAEARKISDPLVIVKSAMHKAQRMVLTENALAEAEGLKAHAESVQRRLEPRE